MVKRKVAKKRQQKRTQTNSLRIIGGQWRSRKFSFPDALGLRPTPDRIRETLFNWLQSDIYNANCLDLFAGSGALGLEALSRGAENVTFIEKNKAVASQLKSNLATLNSKAEVINTDALSHISEENNNKPFDLIFLDPPYRQGLLEKSLTIINKRKWLFSDGLIYVEHEAEDKIDWDVYSLEMLKEASAGQVKCCLLKANC